MLIDTEGVMAKNFRIAMNQTDLNLQLNLAGEFDGSSAKELCHFLEHKLTAAKHVIINTEHLHSIHAFGRRVFQSVFPTLKIHRDRVKFTGKNKAQISPEKG
jgi:anti-anti-sigma regulatory factor